MKPRSSSTQDHRRRSPAATQKAAAQDAWRAVCDLLPDGLCLLDQKGRVLQCNRALPRLLRLPSRSLQGRKLASLLPNGLKLNLSNIRKRSIAQMRDGERWLRVEVHPGAVGSAGALLVVSDATRRKHVEHALQRSERLAAIGKLAGTLAHEINNPVAAVTNALFLLDRYAKLDPVSREYLEMAQEELKRVSQVVRQTLSFYRDTGRPMAVSPARVMDDVLELHARQIQARGATIRKRYGFKGEILTFPADLRHVLSNVFQNALEAVGQRGIIRLHISRVSGGKQARPAGVRMVIADDGAGIPRRLRMRALEPFFTTKTDGGSGLGLWLAECILRERGGSLQLRSAIPGTQRGLAVAIFLPEETHAKRKGARTVSPSLTVMHPGA